MASRTISKEETAAMYLSIGVLALSIVAIVVFVYGYVDVFYVIAIVAVALGFYFVRRLSRQSSKTPERRTQRNVAD